MPLVDSEAIANVNAKLLASEPVNVISTGVLVDVVAVVEFAVGSAIPEYLAKVNKVDPADFDSPPATILPSACMGL